MPCWEVRMTSVEFRAKHRKLLEQAIEALGWKHVSVPGSNIVSVLDEPGVPFTIDLEKGIANIRDYQQPLLNKLKQQYSREALRRAAKLQGWQFKATTQTKGVLRR